MSYRLPGHNAQFGNWCPPEPSASEQADTEGGVSSATHGEVDERAEQGKRRVDRGDDMEQRKRRKKEKKHKREKKHKKKHKKSRKRSSSSDSDSDDSEGGAGAAPAHSSLAPDDWFAARLAKGYAKAERAVERKKKAREAAMRQGQDIGALRAEWSGADVKPPE